MSEVDKRYLRVIDTIVHHYTGKQMLDRVLRMWVESTDLPIYLIAEQNEAESKINAIRVALSKERKKQDLGAHYGMDTSAIFPWTHRSGLKGEAIVIFWRQSKHQRLSQVWDMEIIGKGN